MLRLPILRPLLLPLLLRAVYAALPGGTSFVATVTSANLSAAPTNMPASAAINAAQNVLLWTWNVLIFLDLADIFE